MSRICALFMPLAAFALFALFTAPRAKADSSTSSTQPSGYTVTITVKDATGNPVVGAHVDLINPPPKAAKGAKPAATTPKSKNAKPTPPVAQGVTDSSGIVTFPNIPSGTYEATVSPATPGKKKGNNNATSPANGKTPPIEGMKKVTVAGMDVSVDIALKAAGKKGANGGANNGGSNTPAADAPASDAPAGTAAVADTPAPAGN
jgi:hypothetical protein